MEGCCGGFLFTLTLFSVGCFFLLLAIFGVQVAKYVQTPSEPAPVPMPVVPPEVRDWMRHVNGNYSILLADGSAWQGRAHWWWSAPSQGPSKHIPFEHVPFLENFYLQAEEAFQQGLPMYPPPKPHSEIPDWCKLSHHAQ